MRYKYIESMMHLSNCIHANIERERVGYSGEERERVGDSGEEKRERVG